MPRWWNEGEGWLRGLPAAVERQCERWDLEIVGAVAHGSNAVVVPVSRGGDAFVLRMSPPGGEVVEQVWALRWWAGRGMALLYDDDADAGAMLLERLSTPLTSRPVDEAVAVLGQLMRRLAVPAPDEARSTEDLVRTRTPELEPEWERLGRPFDLAILREAIRVAPDATHSTLAVNGDLHSDQVLAGTREDWLTVDPVLFKGDIEYDLGRVLWTRLDEMPDIVEHFDLAVHEAGLDRDRARDWVIWRTVDYWLWGLAAGLTEDPIRCARLVNSLLP
ncbi:aminoglycoside phosphotransferase family protein [Kribbella solani]|uniref:aminoglycoside phosphotransferase family protein n=1 Tax=Kribbella solani TaxID=236067 RepID=UPI00192DF0A0|nr:aminoglycoside phosphotransferase family protein [Kribbella solani]